MKKITTFFATLFAALHRIWITVFQKILKIWRPVADYTYKSSDYMVKTNIETYRTFLNHFRVFKKNNNKFYYYLNKMIIKIYYYYLNKIIIICSNYVGNRRKVCDYLSNNNNIIL